MIKAADLHRVRRAEDVQWRSAGTCGRAAAALIIMAPGECRAKTDDMTSHFRTEKFWQHKGSRLYIELINDMHYS